MEMHLVHYKTERTLVQETAAVATANGLGYSAAVTGAVTAPVDPAGIAVISYQIDVGFFICLFT